MKTLAEKIAVMQAALEGKEIELRSHRGIKWITYDSTVEPEFNWHIVDYRIKEVPKTKPSINWDHVHPEFKWMATDEDGDTYLFSLEPSLRDYTWMVMIGLCANATNWSSFVPGTCDWKDSLVKRPEEW
jgi:hypothetical protein